MKKLSLLLFILIISFHNQAANASELRQFAKNYFKAWQATQMPEATAEDIERYLAFLKDDIGHQHLPYDPDAARSADGKKNMRKGMTYYLGAHTEYQSELIDIVEGFNVVIIKYSASIKGKHPQTGVELVMKDETVEVLELEDGLVSVVRKYSE